MAARCGGVGQGVVVSFSVDTAIGKVRSAQLPEEIAAAVDFTSLDEIDFMAFCPGSPSDGGQMVLDIFFDTTLALPTTRLVQVVTVTFPIQVAGNASQAVYTASGFITNLGYPNAQSAQPLMQGLTFKIDGVGTEPAFSLETLA